MLGEKNHRRSWSAADEENVGAEYRYVYLKGSDNQQK